MEYSRARVNMVENQLRPSQIEEPRLLAAMLEVPRERFVPKMLRGVAYADEDLMFPDGRFLIEPLVLARLVQTAEVGPEDVVLVLGCSTGYAAAVLARLAGTVILLEPGGLAGQIESLLDGLGVDNVVVTSTADPLAGAPDQAPFQAILLAGSVDEVPQALLDQLAEGGRLVAVVNHGRVGKGTLCTRVHSIIGHKILFDAQIPPLPGVVRRSEFAF